MEFEKQYIKRFISEAEETSKDPLEDLISSIDPEEGSPDFEFECTLVGYTPSQEDRFEVDATGYVIVEKDSDGTWFWMVSVYDSGTNLDGSERKRGFASMYACITSLRQYVMNDLENFQLIGKAED